jgi:hypothetical protein
LDSGNDRNDDTPPEDAFAVLTAQRLLKARKAKPAAPFQRVQAPSIGKWAN